MAVVAAVDPSAILTSTRLFTHCYGDTPADRIVKIDSDSIHRHFKSDDRVGESRRALNAWRNANNG